MARGDSYKALDNILGSETSDAFKVKKEKLEMPTPESNKKEVSDNEKASASFSIDFQAKKPDPVSRLFQIRPEVSREMDNIVLDEDRNRKAGSKGFLSDLANNAIIKELVDMGAVDQSFLKHLKPYE